MFSDLECDYINPIDLCNKLNQVLAHTGCFSFPPLTRRLWPLLFIPTTSVCVTREHRPRLPVTALPPLWPMDGVHSEFATGRVQR